MRLVRVAVLTPAATTSTTVAVSNTATTITSVRRMRASYQSSSYKRVCAMRCDEHHKFSDLSNNISATGVLGRTTLLIY
jgi:hypothetical protein